MSISTGVLGKNSVNCGNALQISHEAASKITGKKFAEITLHIKDKVRTLGDKNTIKVKGKQTAVNPTLFLNRITCILKTSSEMKDFLSYKLAPQRQFMFHNGIIRKSNIFSCHLLHFRIQFQIIVNLSLIEVISCILYPGHSRLIIAGVQGLH